MSHPPSRSARPGVNGSARLAAGMALLLVLGLSLVPATGAAQAKKKVLRLDEFKVEGKIQKPQAFYILPRSNLNYQGLDQAETFLPKIMKSTEAEPF